MALVFTAYEYVPRVPFGHDRFEVLHPQRASLVQLEMDLYNRFGSLTNIEVRVRDTETGQDYLLREARPSWPEPDPTFEEVKKILQNRLIVLHSEGVINRPELTDARLQL